MGNGLSEDEVSAAVRGGCKKAFGRLFDSEANRLFASIRSQGHSCLTAEDIDEIVNDAFYVLWSAITRGVEDDFDPRMYLRWITKKRVISRIRLADGPKAELNRTSSDATPERADKHTLTPVEQLLNQEREAVLDAAIATLSQRELLAIQWCRNREPPDWAAFEAETGIGSKTGRKLAATSKKKLREALEKYDSASELKGGKSSDERNRQTA